MAELPRMPTDVGKLIADTTHMSTEEFGAYGRILFTMWLHGGRLRDDERELARITGLSLRRWRQVAERVCRPLTFAAGEVSQKRLTATWLDVQELRRKHQVGASKRWGGHTAAHGAEHRAQHKHTKDSNIKPSDSESGTARARDAEAPQDSRGRNVASPQLEQQLRRTGK
jgi:uncharacterized protein YdaU (DUF1376 family)